MNAGGIVATGLGIASVLGLVLLAFSIFFKEPNAPKYTEARYPYPPIPKARKKKKARRHRGR